MLHRSGLPLHLTVTQNRDWRRNLQTTCSKDRSCLVLLVRAARGSYCSHRGTTDKNVFHLSVELLSSILLAVRPSSRRPQQPGDHLALETKKKECVGLRPFSVDDCHCHQRGDNWHRLDPSGGCRSPLSLRLQTRLGECDNRNNHSLPRLPGNSETSFVSTVDRCNGFLRGERDFT